MMMNRRGMLKAITVTTLLPSALHAQTPSAGLLAGVRVWPGREVTRVSIESSQPIKFQTLTLTDPMRLVIDLEGADYHDALRDFLVQMPPDNPSVAQVRLARNRPGVVRVVLELRRDVKPDAFILAPVDQYNHRLVLDLRPAAGGDDVIAQFLTQLDAKQRKNAPATNDKVAQKRGRVRVIAIDPGHGGEDPGAIGPGGLKEKDVTLAIALKLRTLINAEPNMKAFLTRDDDFFVPLHERVEKARQARAELLISIHADAFTNPEANGASVFALSERGATSAAARYLAEKENRADAVGGVKQVKLDNEVLAIKREISNVTRERSEMLGKFAVRSMARINRMHKREVEFAGFAVLRSPDVPSILVETAFISNPDEEDKLATDLYQTNVAKVLAASAAQYVRAIG
jgi:N-acetylmuramoyl-L-alanine amidase